jgi:hypothetical protein
MMYNGVQGGHKILFVLGCLLTAGFSLVYFHENRVQSIAGTTIEYAA